MFSFPYVAVEFSKHLIIYRNLDGYVNINRRLITSNISFMATYLVVLMQFKLTLVRQSAKKALIAAMQRNFTVNVQNETQSG